jgi:hypothetical protein
VIYDAAISYAGSEAAEADRLADALEHAGLSVWLDRLRRRVSEQGPHEAMVPAGVEHWRVISEAIDHSATLVVLDSPRWRERDYCQNEFAHAVLRGKRVIAVGTGGPEAPRAAVRVNAGNFAGVADAVADGREVSSAHARLTVAAHLSGPRRERWSTAVAESDAKLFAGADLDALGITLTPDVEACLGSTLRLGARNRRLASVLTVCVVSVLAALALVAVIAAGAAQSSRDRARSAERHVQALADAADSEASTNTVERLRLAESAAALEQSTTTVGALRDALGSLSEGVTETGLPEVTATGVAVSNDGRSIAAVFATGSVVLVNVAGGSAPRVLPANLDAGGAPVFSPDGSRVVFVNGHTGTANVLDMHDGSTHQVAGTANLVGVVFASATEALGVARSGEVVQFDPATPQVAARNVGAVPGPVRAATLTRDSTGGAVSLATLDDAMNLNVGQPGGRPELDVHIDVSPGPYSLAWESIHVCDGDLSVLTTDIADGAGPAFAIPYTVTPSGHAAATGSMIHSFGLVCLPGGGALASDPLQGQESFPEEGSKIVGFTRPVSERVGYAVASSENDEWAAAVGSDGSLRVVDLRAVGRSLKVPSAAVLAPSSPPLVLARDGTLQTVSAGGEIQRIASTVGAGGPVRGAYLDPTLGTVVANGREVLVVRSGHLIRRVHPGAEIETIRPDTLEGGTVASLRDGRLMFVPLAGAGGNVNIGLPADLSADGGELTDAVTLSSGDLAAASSNGSVDVLAFPGGRELRHARVAAPGDLSLAAAGGHLVVGEGDGTVEDLNEQLVMLQARRVLAEGIIDLEPDAAGGLVAAQGGGQVVVLSLPQLFAVAHTGPVSGLGSVAFDPTGTSFLMSTDLAFFGGGNEASVVRWPLCTSCTGTPGELRAAASALSQPSSRGGPGQFLPVRR